MLYKDNMSKRELRHDLVLKALANLKRRQMLDLLKDKPRTTGEMCDRFPDLDRCTVMLHLNVLLDADLIIVKREGRNRWNYINPLPIKDLYDRWISGYSSGALEMLARMKQEIEK